jgi:LDH2 family malate/lactate/ureidoglycolate dehydrogenase
MVELLAGAMIGEFLSIESMEDDGGKGGPPKGGELMIAIDPPDMEIRMVFWCMVRSCLKRYWLRKVRDFQVAEDSRIV